MTPRPVSSDIVDASFGRAVQLVEPALNFVEGLRQGPQVDKSVHNRDRTAGVDRRATQISSPSNLGNAVGNPVLEACVLLSRMYWNTWLQG